MKKVTSRPKSLAVKPTRLPLSPLVAVLTLRMSTKFFTNEEGRTLLEKIEGIFQHKKIHFLDVLVGYAHT